MLDSLQKPDVPAAIFPEGHACAALKRPTFHTIRKSMGAHLVSAIWMDSNYFPDRAGYRTSYDEIYGPGSVNVMPFIASWLSSGPGSDGQGNIVLLPAGIDRSIVGYAERIGLLGAHRFVSSLADFRAAIRETGRRLYAIDSMGPEFEQDVVVHEDLHQLLNSKESLKKVTAFAPDEVIKDMHEVTLSDYETVRAAGAGRVYLKTCNTEAAGAGVFVCNNPSEFSSHLENIRARQKAHNLNRTLIVQPEIVGRNRSFQVFLDPKEPQTIQVITVTDQLVEDDGITYRGSVNYPADAEHLRDVGPLILDMVGRIRLVFPEAFGILMCDFFETRDGRLIAYDPGIRPTGNTATAMAALLSRDLTGRSLHVSSFPLRTKRDGFRFEDFTEKVRDLLGPEALAHNGRGLLPWGWNDKLGFGVLIGVADGPDDYDELRADVFARLGVEP